MDRKHLVIKNLPNEIGDLAEFFQRQYGAISTKPYGRGRAIVRFPNEDMATSALYKLHQSEILKRIISAEYLGTRNIQIEEAQHGVKSAEKINIPDFVKALYATNMRYGFEQPPPPYLRYCYPKINRSILDSISIALMSNSKFYIQVLHLMNRMNLEPPFLARTQPFEPPGEPCDAQTQTEYDQNIENLLRSEESELESDEEIREQVPKICPKRKKDTDIQIKKKAKMMLSSHLHMKYPIPSGNRESDITSVFEINRAALLGTKISLNVASVKLPEKEAQVEERPEKNIEGFKPSQETLPGEVLKSNCISETEMKSLPIFKNYQKGERSNKLYIKNLNKNVTDKDLRLIYERFIDGDSTIDIKLMQHGRMKGQAFIAFNVPDDKLDIVEKALEETNGYVLKNKPMVVCYGKKT